MAAVAPDAQGLGADGACHTPLIWGIGMIKGGGGERSRGRVEFEVVVAGAGDLGVEEVGLAQEVGDEARGGTVVEGAGLADLCDVAHVEDGDLVGHREGFFLIVGDIDGGDAGLGAESADLVAHLEAEFGVEVGEGLVEEEDIGADDEGAGEGDALLLAAGELVWLALGVGVHADGLEGVEGALLAFGLGDFADGEPESDILEDGHVGPERVGLEDHAGVAFVGGGVGDVAVVEEDFAGGGHDESGDHAEEGGLAAAGGPEEEEEVACVDGEGDVVDGSGDAAAAHGGVVLGEVLDGDACGHGGREGSGAGRGGHAGRVCRMGRGWAGRCSVMLR